MDQHLRVEKTAERDLPAVLRAARRHKYLVTLVTLAAGIAAIVLALTANPVYRAEVVITEAQGAQTGSSVGSEIGGLSGIAGINVGMGSNSSRSAQAILQSHHLLEEFIKRNNLIPELFRDSSEKPTLWLAVRHFRDGTLRISDNTKQGTTTLSIDWTDPATAAHWANGLIALTNELVRARALNEATRNVAYLREQIDKTNDTEMRRVMYDLIQTETKTLMLANERPDFAFAIIDPAVPPEDRIRPRRTVMVLIGLVIGLSLGVIAAAAVDHLHKRA